jgi:hypothetical protein
MRRQAPADDVATQRKRSKNARHLLRLLDQGLDAYRTGELRIKVEEPQRYFTFGAQASVDPGIAAKKIAEAEEAFTRTKSPLPLEPDRARVEQWLCNFRLLALKGGVPVVEHFPWSAHE